MIVDLCLKHWVQCGFIDSFVMSNKANVLNTEILIDP